MLKLGERTSLPQHLRSLAVAAEWLLIEVELLIAYERVLGRLGALAGAP